MSTTRLLAVVGPPASEASAHAHLIANGMRCACISVGQMLATEVKQGTHFGTKLAAAQAAQPGRLAPLSLVAPLVQQRLQRLPPGGTVALAGFPRSVEQYKALQTMGYGPELMHLSLSPELQTERLRTRRLCSSCGWPTFESHATCECDRPTVRQAADEAELAAVRMREYEAHTVPLLEHLRGRGIPYHEVEVVNNLPEMDEQLSRVLGGR